MSLFTEMFSPTKAPKVEPVPVAPPLPSVPSSDDEARKRVLLARRKAREAMSGVEVDAAGGQALGAPNLGRKTLLGG